VKNIKKIGLVVLGVVAIGYVARSSALTRPEFTKLQNQFNTLMKKSTLTDAEIRQAGDILRKVSKSTTYKNQAFNMERQFTEKGLTASQVKVGKLHEDAEAYWKEITKLTNQIDQTKGRDKSTNDNLKLLKTELDNLKDNYKNIKNNYRQAQEDYKEVYSLLADSMAKEKNCNSAIEKLKKERIESLEQAKVMLAEKESRIEKALNVFLDNKDKPNEIKHTISGVDDAKKALREAANALVTGEAGAVE